MDNSKLDIDVEKLLILFASLEQYKLIFSEIEVLTCPIYIFEEGSNKDRKRAIMAEFNTLTKLAKDIFKGISKDDAAKIDANTEHFAHINVMVLGLSESINCMHANDGFLKTLGTVYQDVLNTKDYIDNFLADLDKQISAFNQDGVSQ